MLIKLIKKELEEEFEEISYWDTADVQTVKLVDLEKLNVPASILPELNQKIDLGNDFLEMIQLQKRAMRSLEITQVNSQYKPINTKMLIYALETLEFYLRTKLQILNRVYEKFYPESFEPKILELSSAKN